MVVLFFDTAAILNVTNQRDEAERQVGVHRKAGTLGERPGAVGEIVTVREIKTLMPVVERAKRMSPPDTSGGRMTQKENSEAVAGARVGTTMLPLVGGMKKEEAEGEERVQGATGRREAAGLESIAVITTRETGETTRTEEGIETGKAIAGRDWTEPEVLPRTGGTGVTTKAEKAVQYSVNPCPACCIHTFSFPYCKFVASSVHRLPFLEL